MLISEQRLEKALHTLAETDYEYGQWKGSMLRAEYMAEVAEALAFKSLEGTVEDRKRQAKCEEKVRAAWEEYFTVVTKYEQLRARRRREEIIIDVWRSLNSSRSKGVVT